MNIPEGTQTVTAEAKDLKNAIAGAAEALGIHPAQVDYKLDLSHFRSTTGISVARETVRIIAWGSDREAPSAEDEEKAAQRIARQRAEEGAAAGEEREERRERRGRDRGDREERRGRGRGRRDDDRGRDRGEAAKPEHLRGAEEGTTEASEFAQQWFQTVLEFMDADGTVTGTGNEERVHLAVSAKKAGRIIGKRGSTLGAIRHLLGLALEQKFGALTVDVDVEDGRPREERGRRERDRGDRGERGGRGRRGRRERGDRGGEKGRYPEEKLRALARRAADKAVETGQTITINLSLNSYDRRLVHLEISEIEGVESHSEEREEEGRTVKFVQVVPTAS